MYETPEQKEPVFDAKGVETVRRDTCAAVSKVRSSLCSPLTTNDTVFDDCDEHGRPQKFFQRGAKSPTL